MSEIKLRVARPTNQLERISEMYRRGLGLAIVGEFRDHAGFDGIILGVAGASYHLEFTSEREQVAPRCGSAENLIVFYLPDPSEWQKTVDRMLAAGFLSVKSHNPYWDECGRTFEDPEGYRVVLSKQEWSE